MLILRENTFPMKPLCHIAVVAAIVMLAVGTPEAMAQGLLLPANEESMEQLMMSQPSANWDDELENLAALLDNKLNINTATKEQLEQFPFLTDMQIENLHYYIGRYGYMKSVYELQMVSGFDYQTIELLKPYITVDDTETAVSSYPEIRDITKYGRHELLARLDIPFYRRKGYDNAYLGTSQYNSLKYSFRYGDYFQAGLSAEKDAGEALFAANNGKGYDHYAAYVSVSNLGILKSAVLGSYRLSFGQGLVLNSAFRLGKTFSINTSDYRATGVRRNTSLDEYNYFNGLAAIVSVLKNVDVSGFYSRRKLDATVEDGHVTSISSSGLHRTQTEADRRGQLGMQMAGGNMTWNTTRLKLGATGIYYAFDKDYLPSLDGYRRYNMYGRNFYNMSVDYVLRFGRLQISGEEAKGKKGFALLNRAVYSPTNDYQFILLHRFYSEDYWSYYARTFGEGSRPQNENGWYMAVQAHPFAYWQFFASVDLFSFPWRRYRISKASQGQDIMFQAKYTPTDNVSMYMNYRYKRKERDITGTGGEQTLPTHHHKLRYRLTCSFDKLSLQTTADYNIFSQQTASHGFQISQMLSYSLGTALPLSFDVQGSYFNTDDYDSRVYIYERGLLYTFNSLTFSGKGFRGMARLRCDLGDTLMLLAKIGCTHYTDRDEIGSGNDVIRGNTKTDLQLQLRLKF